MTWAAFKTSPTLRTIAASLLAWPLTGILTGLIFEKTPLLDSEKISVWRTAFRWVWVNLFAIPMYGGVFLGHFVFICGLYWLANLTKQAQPGRKASLLTVVTLLVGTILKFASFTFFMGWHWESLLLVADSLLAVLIIFVTKPQLRKSSLLL